MRMLRRIEGVFDEREDKWGVEEEEEVRRGKVRKGEGRVVGGGNVGVGFQAEKEDGDETEGGRGNSVDGREGEREEV